MYKYKGIASTPCCGIEDEEVEIKDTKFSLTPKEIKKELDQYVIGQEQAKKILSVAVYNHYKRINNKSKDIEIQKSNILILGSTGSGKTLLAQTLAKILDVPFAIADATTLTQAGYVGDDVENVLVRLIQNADYDIKLAEKGIIYIDEIDKITRKSENVSITRDVAGEGVQQALLKIIEGTISRVPVGGGRKHPSGDCHEINTKDILFICGGAFDGIENIINSKTETNSIGFGANITSRNTEKLNNVIKNVKSHDLVKFGLIPELIGRLPVIATLESLDEQALINILTLPKNAITKQYQKLLEFDGVKLKFEEDALKLIAQIALKRNTGARGLRSILEEIMLDVMFEVPSDKRIKKFTISKQMIEEKVSKVA